MLQANAAQVSPEKKRFKSEQQAHTLGEDAPARASEWVLFGGLTPGLGALTLGAGIEYGPESWIFRPRLSYLKWYMEHVKWEHALHWWSLGGRLNPGGPFYGTASLGVGEVGTPAGDICATGAPLCGARGEVYHSLIGIDLGIGQRIRFTPHFLLDIDYAGVFLPLSVTRLRGVYTGDVDSSKMAEQEREAKEYAQRSHFYFVRLLLGLAW